MEGSVFSNYYTDTCTKSRGRMEAKEGVEFDWGGE